MSLISQMQRTGLWDSFEKQVVGLEPVLKAMSDRGMPVDPTAYAEVLEVLKLDMAKALEQMQALVPQQLKKVQTYKKTPAKATAALFQVDVKCTHTVSKKATKKRAATLDEYNPESCPMCLGTGTVKVWCRNHVWKPSNKSLVAYMKLKGHPVPRDFKDEKDTTNQRELLRLYRSTHDELYITVLHYRKAQTVLSNHMKNWKPGADGRVHPVFYFDPATGQLSSRRPNAQNAPHHDDPEMGGYADIFRSMIRPANPEEKWIVEFDYHGFHVQTLAFNAEDADMLRLAKMDIHSFVTAHFLRLGNASRLIALPDDELREYLARIKKEHKHIRNAQVKHALLGYNNGMGAHKLYLQYKEFFNNEREAKQVMKLLDSLFPKAKRYRDEICQKAHDQGYLISRHGYIRYFWEVFKWKAGKGWGHGDDHEAALCYFTQNDAHGELRDRLRIIHEKGLAEKYNMINTIHDSIMFEWPRKLLDEVGVIKDIMEMPSKVLVNSICPNGLSVEVDVSGGPDWAHMQALV